MSQKYIYIMYISSKTLQKGSAYLKNKIFNPSHNMFDQLN